MNKLEKKRKDLLKSSYMMALFICIFLFLLSTGNGNPAPMPDWVYFGSFFTKILMCVVVAGAVKSFVEKLLWYFESKELD